MLKIHFELPGTIKLLGNIAFNQIFFFVCRSLFPPDVNWCIFRIAYIAITLIDQCVVTSGIKLAGPAWQPIWARPKLVLAQPVQGGTRA